MRHRSRRFVAILLLCTFGLQVSGCTHWTAYAGPPATVEPKPKAHDMRVTLLDSTKVELTGARVEGDTVIGFAHGRKEMPSSGSRIGLAVVGTDSLERRIARDQMARLEVRTPNSTATAVLAFAAVASIIAIVVAAIEWDGGLGCVLDCH
jgi:hypothetical protein